MDGPTTLEKLDFAAELAEENKLDDALRIVLSVLDEDFDNPKALFLAGFIFIKSEKTGLAYQMYDRASKLMPNVAATWSNMGKCFHEKQMLDKAEECFRKALKVKPEMGLALNNLGLISLNRSEYGQAIEYCNRALKSEPDMVDAKINRGMAYLALGKWKEGWKGYNLNLGTIKDRKERTYRDEPRWDGSKGKKLICYGEQGIGDEISFASCLPDLIRDSKDVILECDKRTETLFKRSFPSLTVYGTRYDEVISWPDKEDFEARVAIGQLPQFYRNSDSDFPGTPYLIPNPDMAVQWKALLDTFGDKPRIGISWTGGRPHTWKSRRSVTLQTLLPLFKAIDATWVSLQYHDAPELEAFEESDGVKIHHWPWGVQSYDYDPTVALISQLDLVISVTTTVVHVAGGLGKECWCLVPEKVMWRYGVKGEKFPWANSVTLFRQKGREWPVHILAAKLREKFCIPS